MSVQFSGNFIRVGAPSRRFESPRSMNEQERRFVAQLEIAAEKLSSRIQNEFDDRFALTYDPYNARGSLIVRERASVDGEFDAILDRDANYQQVGTSIYRQDDEPAETFLLRGLAFAKQLELNLMAVRTQKEDMATFRADLTGWVTPHILLNENALANRGKEDALKLVAALKTLRAETAAHMPEGMVLELDRHYGDTEGLLTLAVKQKKPGTENALDGVCPTEGKYSAENTTRQELRVLFPGIGFIPRWVRKETDEAFIRRGIALAKTLAERQHARAEFDAMYDIAMAETFGNVSMEERYFLSSMGLAASTSMLSALKIHSEALHQISPRLQLVFSPDRKTGAKQSIRVLYQEPDSSYAGPILGLESNQDYHRAMIERKPRESDVAFVRRAVEASRLLLVERQEREMLSSRVPSDPSQDQGFRVG